MTQQIASLKDFLAAVKLPAIPEVAMLLLQTLNKDDLHITEITSLIERDPSIAATVLKHANSSRYGLSNKVGNISDAIRVLGFNNVRIIALAASVASAYPIASGLDKDEFWKSSSTTADFASAIAAKLKRERHTPWMVGFLLRVGELMIAQYDIHSIATIEALPMEPGQRWKREFSIFGLTEGQVVAQLADSWNFPEAIVNALRTAADPLSDEWAFFEDAAIVHIAALMSDMKMAGITDVDTMMAHLPVAVLNEINVDLDFYKDLYSPSVLA